MFSHLIESESHAEEFKRKGRFFLVTLAGYAALFLFAGVASIYAYDANLENQNLEFVTLLTPVEQVAQPVTPNQQSANTGGRQDQIATRPILFERVDDSSLIPEGVSPDASPIPAVPPGPVGIGPNVFDPGSGGPGPAGPGPGGNGPRTNVATQVVAVDPPPLPAATAAPAVPAIYRPPNILNSRALQLPKPDYPELAKKMRIQGPVSVQLLIDETGKVISARATSGNPMLYPVSVRAAFQARFSPTKVSNVPVKVAGIITYNFVLQ